MDSYLFETSSHYYSSTADEMSAVRLDSSSFYLLSNTVKEVKKLRHGEINLLEVMRLVKERTGMQTQHSPSW